MKDLPTTALSIRQPWAWAIINAGKDIENRDWPTKFRGLVCIHAAKAVPSGDFYAASEFIANAQRKAGVLRPNFHPSRSFIEKGGIIGTAEIVDCVEASGSPWFMGRYGFVLQNVRLVDFIPVRGALGFFDWRKNLVQITEPTP